MKKRVLSVVLFCAMLFSILPTEANADVLKKDLPTVNAASYAIVDGESKQVLFGEKYNEAIDPGALVQMMTAVLIIENGNLNDAVVVPEIPEAANNGNRLYQRKGEKVNLNDLLEGIIIYNANDAAIAAANHLSGSQEAFVDEMNARAKELGMKDTVFTSVYGPGKKQVSTAKDMALLAAHAESLPKYVELAIQPDLDWDSEMNQDRVINVNGMQEVEPESVGLKVDTADDTHLAAGITKGDREIVGVMLNCKSEDGAYVQMQDCLNIALDKTATINLVKKGATVTTMNFGKDKVIRVAPAKNYSVTASRGNSSNYSTVISLDQVALPIREGAKVGAIKIYDGEDVVDEVPLKAENGANAGINGWKIFAIILIILYIISMIYILKNVNRLLHRKASHAAPKHGTKTKTTAHPTHATQAQKGKKPAAKSHSQQSKPTRKPTSKPTNKPTSDVKRKSSTEKAVPMQKKMQNPSIGSNAGRQGLEQRLKDKKNGGYR